MDPAKLVSMRTPKQVTYPIQEFMDLPTFPGARDSRTRAPRATHLFTLLPEHTKFEAAECDGTVYRLTGNTRRWVWALGLSDSIPANVIGDVYECKNLDEVREIGLHFDSPEAAWRSKDYSYRSIGIAFNDTWRPGSHLIKVGRLARPLRLADAYVRERYTPDRMAKVELVTPRWTEEIVALDPILSIPYDEDAMHPFKTGTLAAFLLLLHHENKDAVAAWIRAAINNEGTKDAHGMDAVQCLVEVFKLDTTRRRGTSAATVEYEHVKKTLAAFELLRNHSRTPRLRQIDPLVYIKAQRKRTNGVTVASGEALNGEPEEHAGNPVEFLDETAEGGEAVA